MGAIIYESNDVTFLGIIEQALTDNEIPYTVIGGADTGLASAHLVRISVPMEYIKEAQEIVNQLT